jgi:peptide deformylase
MKPIVHIPNTVLSTTAKKIEMFDKKLATLISDMKETLEATTNPKGVGLAAPQVGESLRLFLTKPTEKAAIRVFINPVIIQQANENTSNPDTRIASDSKLEGCLSIPDIWGHVHRNPTVTLQYLDETGKQHTETFTGFIATIIQHETDHINGILFTQRVLEQKGKLYEIAQDDDGKEVLEEIGI